MLPQVIVEPTQSPVLNNGGWVYNAAVLLAVVGALIGFAVVLGYMRFAPRFQTSENGQGTVRAPRIQPGKDVRRPVKVVGAPAAVPPPNVAAPAPAAPSAPAPATTSAPAPAAPSARAPVATTPAPGTPAEAAPAPAAPTPAPAEAAPAPVAAPTGEHKEVSLDQETFDKVLAELLEKGTDRRVAEGQARRAAMIAARKKAQA